MFTSENHAGCLVELRLASPIDEAEMADLTSRHLEVLAQTPDRYVIAVDLRRAYVFPAAITDRFIGMMSQVNPRLERSALLINESAILGLQAERAIEEAGNPNRRTFRTSAELKAWLAEVLTTEERQRLDSFLARGVHP